MSYDNCLDSESTLRETLDRSNVDELKKLVVLLPGVTLKVPRKAELVGALERFLLGDGAVQLWSQLQALDQAMLMEVVHSDDGTLDVVAFQAKYGAVPAFEVEGKTRWQRTPTLLGLFLHPGVSGGRVVPGDLREKLRAFVPRPSAAKLSILEDIPEQPARQWTSHQFDEKKRARVYEQHQAPLLVRLTEQAAVQDLRTVLRLIDQEKISVSQKTLLPSRATMTVLNDLLHEHDFFEITEKINSWDPEIGPVKAFSWPVLVQAAKFAALRNGKLRLTKTGRAALEAPPAHALREIWNAWVTRGNRLTPCPDALGSSKVRDAAAGRDARAGKDQDALGRAQESDEPFVSFGFAVHGPIVRRVQAEARGDRDWDLALGRDASMLRIWRRHL